MAKKKFRVLKNAAAHHGDLEGGHKVTPRGGVIESDLDLDKLFVNKFERLNAKGQPAVEFEDEEPLNGPATSKAVDPKDTTPAKGSELKSIEATPAEREEALADAASGDEEEDEKPKKKPASKKKPAKSEEPDDDDDGTDDDDDDGEDVTAQFKAAKDNDLTVTKTEDGHVVKDGKKVLTDKPLRTKKQVEAFIDKHLDGD